MLEDEKNLRSNVVSNNWINDSFKTREFGMLHNLGHCLIFFSKRSVSIGIFYTGNYTVV